ncbi:MAG: hypothetical protein ACRD9Q_06465 [Nitrososphaeraceae archaeon]
MDLEQINDEIKKMGYTPFITRMERPNYYRLEDGSILRVYSVLNNVIMNQQNPTNANISAQNVVAVFVPTRLRGTPSNQLYTQADYQANMETQDMIFETLIENFNVYEVDDKWIMSIKTTLSQVGKTRLYNTIGEPIYLVNTTPIPKFKPK